MHKPIDVYLPAARDDPRFPSADPSGVIVRRGPALHPDDIVEIDGLRVTSVARTLIDLAEVMEEDELHECFVSAAATGKLDPAALRAARERVEWRPSLALLDRMIEEFAPEAAE